MRRIPILLTLATLCACDIPTKAPQWDVEWNVPSTTTRIPISSLLPPQVAVSTDSSAFVVDIAPVVVTENLGTDCPACGTMVAPKPEFTLTENGGSWLPTDLLSATLQNASLQVAVESNLNFDPLRPSADPAAARGWAVLEIRNGSTLLGRDSVNGSTVALPPGGTLARNIPLQGDVDASSPIMVYLTLYSPAGDPVSADPSSSITMTASAPDLEIASPSIAVNGKQVSANTDDIDLSNVGASLSDRVLSGALVLAIDNPIAVAGTLTARLTGPGVLIQKSIDVAPGATTQKIAFTQAEMQSLFGKAISVEVFGPVSASGASVVLAPTQVIVVTTRLDVVLTTEKGN